MGQEAVGAGHLKHLELVALHTTNLVVVTNRERQIEWVNPAYTQVTGWSLDEVRGKNPRSFLHGPRTDPAAVARLAESLRKGEPVTDFELLNYKKTGEPYWVSLSIQPITNEQGEVTQYVAIESDITHRKRAQQETAHLLDQLIETQRMARLGWVEHDLAGDRLRYSDEVARLLDGRAVDVVPACEGLLAVVHREDVARMRALYTRAVNSGELLDAEFRVMDAQHRVKWVHVRGMLQGWDDGRPALFRMVLQDITERREAERLRREKELLEREARTQVLVLTRISHELRTPLHAVLGFAEAVARTEASQLSPRARAQLAQIREAAQHLLLLVNDLLDLTRLRGEGLPLHIGAVDVRALCEESLRMVAPLAQRSGVALELEPAPAGEPPLKAAADPQRLKQVLINLLANAIKYNRPQGYARVRCAAEGDAPVADARIVIEVRDAGLGISEADRARLFEPFYRGAGGLRRTEGSGLGLPIAKALVHHMGGDIHVESQEGEGSCFRVTLRRASADGEAASPASTQPGDAAGTVLYIDDDELSRALAESVVEGRPRIRLVTSDNAREGMELARALRPGLILIDLDLGGSSGFDVMREVLDDPVLRRVPCVAFSADADDQAMDAAIRAGFREYWCKPLAREQLLEGLDRLLAPQLGPLHL